MGRQATYMLLVAVGCCCVSIAMAENNRAGTAAFFETFGSGWTSRWHYSASKKYKGRFQVVQPPGFQDTAIKVSQPGHLSHTGMPSRPLHRACDTEPGVGQHRQQYLCVSLSRSVQQTKAMLCRKRGCLCVPAEANSSVNQMHTLLAADT